MLQYFPWFVLFLHCGILWAAPGLPGVLPPPWFVLRLSQETALERFQEFIRKPGNLSPDCVYGGKARIVGIHPEEERTIVRIEYRLLCIEFGPFPRRPEEESSDTERQVLMGADLRRPRTVMEPFVYRWTGEAWRLEDRLEETRRGPRRSRD